MPVDAGVPKDGRYSLRQPRAGRPGPPGPYDLRSHKLGGNEAPAHTTRTRTDVLRASAYICLLLQ
jgi:hypothetical protein